MKSGANGHRVKTEASVLLVVTTAMIADHAAAVTVIADPLLTGAVTATVDQPLIVVPTEDQIVTTEIALPLVTVTVDLLPTGVATGVQLPTVTVVQTVTTATVVRPVIVIGGPLLTVIVALLLTGAVNVTVVQTVAVIATTANHSRCAS